MSVDACQTAQERFCRPIVAAHERDTASDGTGPQIGPEGAMEPLAGLRVYVGRHARMDEMTKAVLAGYIDGIEREVADMVPLPVDADGVPIHIGDVMDEQLPFGGYAAPAPVDTMELYRGAGGYGWMVKLDAENRALINPKLLRHHHAPTVEDVLDEFAHVGIRIAAKHGIKAGEIDFYADEDAIAEFAAKLALRGDE